MREPAEAARLSPASVRALGYRPDIDGLRAVAVLAVVLYHANVPLFSGGLAGVDVFFVISGFLITRILHRQSQAGDFSILRFYARRILRIFPALFVVLTVTTALGWMLLPPPDVATMGQSLAASALFAANLYFLGQGSYYASHAQQAPLLHLWSLSVEEQFYLALPWLLWACRDWTRSRQAAGLAVLFVASFGLAIGLGNYSATAAFYFGPSRAWELLLGGVLALAPATAFARRWVAPACGPTGIVLIALAIGGQFSDWLPQGAEPLIACVGAALVIAAGHAPVGPVTHMLATRPLVFIGLISYSLYLWHWPLLVIYRSAWPLQPAGEGFVIAAAFALAAVTWSAVEQPARNIRAPRSRIFWLAGAGTTLLLVVAAFLWQSRGGVSRFPPKVQWLYSFDGYEAKDATRQDRCFLTPRRLDPKYLDRQACLPQTPGKPAYLLVGDSHAAHLWLGLARALPEVAVQQATASGCRPLLYGPRDADCQRFMDEVLSRTVSERRPHAVILSARWGDTDVEPLRRTIATLNGYGVKVVVLGPLVEYQQPLPRVLALAELHDDPSLVDRARVRRTIELDRIMATQLEHTAAGYVSLYRLLCPPTRSDCVTMTPSGVPVQFDYGHPTREGSLYIGQEVRESLLER